jgi:hypothetical protein
MAGACKTLVFALRDNLMEYPYGAEVCSGAMLNLVTYGTTAKSNRSSLVEAGKG